MIEERSPANRKQKAKRKCLKCGKEFSSPAPAIKLCNKCKYKIKEYDNLADKLIFHVDTQKED